MASGVFARHGNGEELVFVVGVELWRQAVSFVSEDEPVSGFEGVVVEASRGLGAAEDQPLRGIVAGQEIIPVFIDCDVEERPVVESRPFQVGFVQ